MAVKSVSVIGVGAIGAPIARRIVQAGFQVTVCDRSQAALAGFGGLPVKVARNPSECASADAILVLVASPAQVREVILGRDGIIAGLQADASPVVAIMSTVGPAEMLDLKGAIPDARVRLVDAPVSGGVIRAEQGKLAVLVSGEVPDINEVEPVLMCAAAQIFRVGSLGAAQTVKVVNNIVAAASVLVTAEAYRLALDRGIDLADITPVLDAGSGRNHLSQAIGAAEASYSGWTKSRGDFDSVTSIIRKDLGIAQQLALTSSTPMPFVATMASFLESQGNEIYEAWRSVGRRSVTGDH